MKKGDKVHYFPRHGNKQNGIVKSEGVLDETLFVVYNCNGDWENYSCYTGALTNVSDLRPGWIDPEEKEPLYKRLNKERTQGEWDCGYGEASNAYGVFTKKMLEEGLPEHPICLVSPIDKLDCKDKANAEYTVLAVNNLSVLAEALANTIKIISGFMYLSKEEKENYNKAKEALKKIS